MVLSAAFNDSAVATASISVVIPCHNQARWVASAVDSVTVQAPSSCEIFVVNDGSSDGTAEAVATRPQAILINQPRQGVSAARNTGFRMSSGKYVTFLDADDLLAPDWIAVAVTFLEGHPDYGLVYGHVELVDEEGRFLRRPPRDAVFERHYEALLRRNYIWSPGCVVYRRSALEAAGPFDRALSGAADLELNFRILRRFPAQCVDRIALNYRCHGSSMSTNSSAMLEETLEVLRRERSCAANKAQLRELRHHERLARTYFGNRLAAACLEDLRSGEWRKAISGLQLLVKHHPTGPARLLWGKISRSPGAEPATGRAAREG